MRFFEWLKKEDPPVVERELEDWEIEDMVMEKYGGIAGPCGEWYFYPKHHQREVKIKNKTYKRIAYTYCPIKNPLGKGSRWNIEISKLMIDGDTVNCWRDAGLYEQIRRDVERMNKKETTDLLFRLAMLNRRW